MPIALDWSRIDTILCDMDGTLLDLGFDNHFWQEQVPRHWAEARGLGLDQAKSTLVPMFAEQRGRLDWYCLDYWSGRLELDLVAMKTLYAHGIRFLPGVPEALNDLRTRGLGLLLVTNAHPESLRIKAEQTGLLHYFDAAHSTHSYGFPKETAEFWSVFAARAGLDLGRCLLIDDTDSVLAGALDGGVGQVLAIRQTAIDSPPNPMTGDFPELLSLAELRPAV